MRILYGVTGEGMGHATRSKVILTHLASRGHEIKIVVSGRAHGYLARFFPDVEEIHGLHIAYEDNAVKRRRTVWELLKEMPAGLRANYEKYRDISESFKPDVVISDFESFSHAFGKQKGLPVISIDNMSILSRCAIEVPIPKDAMADFQTTKPIVAGKVARSFHYLITTFFFPKIVKDRTSLYPPILRDEVLARQPTPGDHILVYQTSTSNSELLPVLRSMDRHRFVVYGLRRDEDLGNVQLRDFSETKFVDDLASARAVIAGGGFSLMGEAVYLGKPLLAVPVKHQFEQTLNALYLEQYGYGEYHRDLSAEGITRFLGRVDEYTDKLHNHRQEGNRLIFEGLDRLLPAAAEAGRQWAGR
ncbi:MAG TPA: MJ1255/VC2487 family glycosyltransferase [Polyangia bacterium]|jgi:uncharacterized protein (TIGR00661 family)